MVNPADFGYREYAPCSALRSFVECYWTSVTSQSDRSTRRRVLPDGCIDIIFEPTLSEYADGAVVGTMSRALLFEAAGPIGMLAVRFRPGGARPFFKIPAYELTDDRAPLHEMLPRGFTAERLYEAPTVRQKVDRLEAQLLALLPSAPKPDTRVDHAIRVIEQGGSVESAATTVDLTRQHLTRLFRAHVGVGPKMFARIGRLQMLVNEFPRQDHIDWSAWALRFGYFDQAHMISDCRLLTGLTPAKLLESRS